MRKYISIYIFALFFTDFVYSQQQSSTCSRTADYKDKKILVDGITGIKGSGLSKLMKNNPSAMRHLRKYQEMNNVQVFNLVSGSVSTLSIATGLLYTGDKSSKSNFLLFGAVIALVNFLTTKTVEFYNERELTLAIEEFNKTSEDPIRLIDKNRLKKKSGTIFVNKNWSF